jgi:hypothetical protein
MLACCLWLAWSVPSSAKYRSAVNCASIRFHQDTHDPHQPPPLAVIDLTHPQPLGHRLSLTDHQPREKCPAWQAHDLLRHQMPATGPSVWTWCSGS